MSLWDRSSVRRLVTVVVGAAMSAATLAPAGAETLEEARRAREATRQRKAETAAALDTLKESDRAVEAALADLNAAARTANARAVAARQAADAADAEVAAARAEMAATQARIDELTAQVRERAIAAYVAPRDDVLFNLGDVADLAALQRREVFLSQVASHDADVLDHLDAAREDLGIRRRQAAAAAAKAAERRAEADAAAAAANAARAEQQRVAAALDARIAELSREVDALAKEESRIQSIIRAKESAAYGGGAVSASGLIWPVRGRVTSEYGYRWGRQHQGIDIGAPTGTPIWAAKDGVVIHAAYTGGYGNAIIIDHGGGFTTVYAHQSRLAVGEGTSVKQRQVIGYVGSTGRSTGPHLHFETRFNGRAANPRNSLP